MGLIAHIKRFFRGNNIDNNNSLINNSKIMAKKTVITKVLDANAQDGIIEFPQNRTLYADQFTDVAPNTDEDREGFKAKSMKEVFEHYQPSKEGIALETEEGGAVYENFEFRQIKDFEDEQLIEQSELLSGKKPTRQRGPNWGLRNILLNPISPRPHR